MSVMARRILGVSMVTLGMVMSVHAAPFTGGNLVIYRIGDGVAPLASTGSVVFLDEYATNGTLVQSIPLPLTKSGGNNPFVSSGVATSEGGLSLSADGQYLLLQGYATNLSYGGTSLANSLSTIVPRVVGRVDFDGNIDTSTILSNWATGNNPRSVVSTDGTSIWIGGAGAGFGAGVGYTTLGSNNFTTLNVISGGVTNKPLNVARLGIFGGQLYLSTVKTTNGIYAVGTGLPTTINQIIAPLNGLPGNGASGTGTGGPFNFVFLPQGNGTNLNTLYYAEDGENNDAAGVFKYSLVGTNWVLNGAMLINDLNPKGFDGLTGALRVSGNATSAVLYATAGGSTAGGGGFLYVFTDTAGYNAAPAGSPIIIATAGTNTVFRGVAFAPVAFRNLSASRVGNDMNITWSTTGGKSYALQATAVGPGGSYSTNSFVDISSPILLPGGTPQTNFVDVGGITNSSARYYRARQLP